jgi:hypothetical protein
LSAQIESAGYSQKMVLFRDCPAGRVTTSMLPYNNNDNDTFDNKVDFVIQGDSKLPSPSKLSLKSVLPHCGDANKTTSLSTVKAVCYMLLGCGFYVLVTLQLLEDTARSRT